METYLITWGFKDIFIIVWLALIGAILGSFLGCMGYRIPNKIKTTYPSSFCASCKKPLKWFMNVPILSYIIQRGRCLYCGDKIGPIYFICELLGFVLFPLSYILYGYSINFFISIILTGMLIVTIVSDFKYFYISDRVLVISSILLLITFYVLMDHYDLMVRVVAAVILFLVMEGLKIMGNAMFNRESLGDGDIKLMAVIGLALGILYSFVALFLGSVIGLICSLITIKKNKDGIIPFGPYLIMGALIANYLFVVIDEAFSGLF